MALPNTLTNGTLPDADEVMANFTHVYNPFTQESPAFGGDGSDGALSTSSGTTSLTRGTVYQYSSISITGTAVIDATGGDESMPIIIKCSGNCTINVAGTAFNLAGAGMAGGAEETGGTGLAGFITGGTANNLAGGGGGAGAGGNGTAGVGGTAPGGYVLPGALAQHVPLPGAGGAGGGSSGSGGGVGGAGGGAVYLEVAGNLTVTSGTFDVSGEDGTAGTSQSGGGGGGGSIVIFVAGSVTDSGTYTATGGSGATTGDDGGDGGPGKVILLSRGA